MNEDLRNGSGDGTGTGDDGAGKAPHLDESVRRIGKAGRATLASGIDTGRALRKLVLADLALARSALPQALVWCAVAIIFGASAWLLLMGAAIALLQALGLSWLAATSITAVLSLACTALAGWRMWVYFHLGALHATRRQLTRLGVIDEDEDDDGDDASARKEAA
ncbi:phage holin family protein [Luteimonas salinilitoris]|uniref:phage holin family protein n=1 Tax=Luteimonas salinilitoris TaxID=3237697 RepID=UPI00351C5715